MALYEETLRVDGEVRDEMQRTIDETEASLKQKMTHSDSAMMQAAARQKVIDEQEEQIDTLTANVDDLHQQLRVLTSAARERQQQHAAQLEQLRAERDDALAANDRLKADARDLKAEMQYLRGKVESKKLYRAGKGSGSAVGDEHRLYLRELEREQETHTPQDINAPRKAEELERRRLELRKQHKQRVKQSRTQHVGGGAEFDRKKGEGPHKLLMKTAIDGDVDTEFADDDDDIGGGAAADTGGHVRLSSTTMLPPALRGDLQQHPPRRELVAEFDARQFPADCEFGQRALVFSYDSFNRYGFATALHHLSLAMLYARDTNRVLVVRDPDRWIYTTGSDGSGGCSHGFKCFFEDISRCTEANVVKSVKGLRRQALNVNNEDDPVVFYTSSGATYNVVTRRGSRYRTLWWRATVMQYLLKPRPYIKESMEAFKAEQQWLSTTRVIGIHVRHGDKKTEGYARHQWQEYLAKAVAMREQWRAVAPRAPPLSAVFVATDNPDVVAEAVRSGSEAGFRVFYRDEERTNDAVHALLTAGRLSGFEQGKIALENILLLASCDQLIGTFSSSFFKLAYELRFARTSDDYAESLDLSRWQA